MNLSRCTVTWTSDTSVTIRAITSATSRVVKSATILAITSTTSDGDVCNDLIWMVAWKPDIVTEVPVSVPAVIAEYIKKKCKVFPLQARCGPEGGWSYSSSITEDIGRVVKRDHDLFLSCHAPLTSAGRHFWPVANNRASYSRRSGFIHRPVNPVTRWPFCVIISRKMPE